MEEKMFTSEMQIKINYLYTLFADNSSVDAEEYKLFITSMSDLENRRLWDVFRQKEKILFVEGVPVFESVVELARLANAIGFVMGFDKISLEYDDMYRYIADLSKADNDNTVIRQTSKFPVQRISSEPPINNIAHLSNIPFVNPNSRPASQHARYEIGMPAPQDDTVDVFPRGEGEEKPAPFGKALAQEMAGFIIPPKEVCSDSRSREVGENIDASYLDENFNFEDLLAEEMKRISIPPQMIQELQPYQTESAKMQAIVYTLTLLKQSAEALCHQIRVDVEVLENQCAEMTSKKQQLEIEIKNGQAAISTDNHSIQRLDASITEQKKSLEEKEKEIVELSQKNKTLEDEIQRSKKSNEQLIAVKEKIDSDYNQSIIDVHNHCQKLYDNLATVMAGFIVCNPSLAEVHKKPTE